MAEPGYFTALYYAAVPSDTGQDRGVQAKVRVTMKVKSGDVLQALDRDPVTAIPILPTLGVIEDGVLKPAKGEPPGLRLLANVGLGLTGDLFYSIEFLAPKVDGVPVTMDAFDFAAPTVEEFELDLSSVAPAVGQYPSYAVIGPSVDSLLDATAVGKAVVRAADQAAARTAIGAVDQAAVTAAVDAVISGAPGALDTLNELAAALGDDANFAATITAALAGKQPLDADLTAIAALTPTDNDIAQRKSGAWTNRTPAQFKTDLALAKADVGLGNVDNTADLDKPVSTAQQTAINAAKDRANHTGTQNASTISGGTFPQSMVTGLVDNTQRTDEAWNYAQAGTAAGEAIRTAEDATAQRAAIGFTSATRAATSLISIEDFLPDTDYAAALSAAIDAADLSGGTVIHQAGKTYTATSGVSKTDVDARIDWNGAKVVRAAGMANVALLELNYSISPIQNVVAITNQSYDWGGSPQATPVSRIEVASTAGWAAGDWAVIVSDDEIPGTPATDNSLEGERVRVAAVSGSYIYLARRLRVTLTTNVRIARMTVRDVVLDNIWVEDASGSPVTRNASAVDIRQAVQPRVTNAVGRNLMADCVEFAGCVGGVIDESDMHNLRTSSANGAWGYGFRLSSCCDFDIHGIRGSFLRHLISTTAYFGSSSTPNDLWRYGSNLGHRVVSGSAREVGHPGFDTHDEAAFVEFDTCFVGWNHQEPEGSFRAFTLRGRDNVLRNCVSYGPQGFVLLAEDGGGRHRVVNYSHTTPAGLGNLGGGQLRVDYRNRTTRGQAEVSARLYAPGTSGLLFEVFQADVRIPILELVGNSEDAGWALISITDSKLAVDTLIVDISGSTGTTRIFDLQDSLSVVRVEKLIVRTGGAPWRFGDFRTLNGTITIGRVESDTNPVSTGTAGFNNIGGGATHSVGDVLINQRSILADFDIRADASITLTSFARSTQLLDVALTAARTITEPGVNLHVGRTIRYVRTINATGAFNWNIGDDALTTAGTWLERMWNGSAWITIGKGTL